MNQFQTDRERVFGQRAPYMCLFKMVGSDFIVTPSGKDLCNQKVPIENSLQFQLELLYPENK